MGVFKELAANDHNFKNRELFLHYILYYIFVRYMNNGKTR